MPVSRIKPAKKSIFLRPSKLNARSLRSVDHSQNVICYKLWMCGTFGLCFKILHLPVFVWYCSYNWYKSSFSRWYDYKSCSLSFLKQSPNLIGYTSLICGYLGSRFRFLALIVLIGILQVMKKMPPVDVHCYMMKRHVINATNYVSVRKLLGTIPS